MIIICSFLYNYHAMLLMNGEFVGNLNCVIDEPTTDEYEFDEESTIRYYYRSGFEYKEIISHLEKRHGHNISKSTLLRRLRAYGLSRRHQQVTDAIHQQLRTRLEEIINGPGSCGGYRTVWHTLQIEGWEVPRNIVASLLKEMDPEGVEFRKARRLKRRQYNNPGPNYAWHIDGYDKVKPWGFDIHGGIDGFSRKLLWLKVGRSNKSPDNIAYMYLNSIIEVGGCPVELVTDLGTENAIVAAIQSYFRDNPDAHRYVPSPRNQRIESWWSILSKTRTIWWRNFFSDLEFQGILDLSDELNKECLWYTFSGLIRKELDHLKEHWNTHRIRKSRHNCVAGRPDSIFYIPENYGGTDMKIVVAERDIVDTLEDIVENEEENEYTEYFDYVMTGLSLELPTQWEDALSIYQRLLNIARLGN